MVIHILLLCADSAFFFLSFFFNVLLQSCRACYAESMHFLCVCVKLVVFGWLVGSFSFIPKLLKVAMNNSIGFVLHFFLWWGPRVCVNTVYECFYYGYWIQAFAKYNRVFLMCVCVCVSLVLMVMPLLPLIAVDDKRISYFYPIIDCIFENFKSATKKTPTLCWTRRTKKRMYNLFFHCKFDGLTNQAIIIDPIEHHTQIHCTMKKFGHSSWFTLHAFSSLGNFKG